MSTQLGSRPAPPKPSWPSRRVAAAPRSRLAAIPAGHLARQAGTVAPAEASDFVVDWQLRASEVRGG